MPLPPTEGSIIARRYVLRRLLGRGGMGMVYLAYDRKLGRDIAIKIAVPGREPAASIHRFQLEATALASIDSQNVVKLHAFGRSRDTSYYTMDYVEGVTVDRIVARESGALPLDFVLSTMRDVGRGLEHIHRAGFVHRDVKPSNILVERASRRAILFDLGLVCSWRVTDNTMRGIGSPPYMAPEQSGCAFEAGSDEIGPWTDEYALACTGFEMLTGSPPFVGETIGELLRQHLLAQPPKLSTFRPELEPFDRVFLRALAKAPAERYGSASAMVGALARARRSRGLVARLRDLFPAQRRTGMGVPSRA